MYLSTALTLALTSTTFAHPLAKRNGLPPVVSEQDASVLQLALYLEHLETALYTGGYNAFTEAQYEAEGFPAGFRDNVAVIAQHETTHADTISAILTSAGKSPVPPCEYSFPYNSPTSFVDLANAITSVGIGAYLGGGALLTDDPELLTAATSILTVESRHDAYLRAGVGGSPFPTPFDTSLPGVFAYNLAQMFIKQCPQQLPIIILPKLKLESPPPPSDPHLKPVAAGTELVFSYDPATFFVPVDSSKPLYIGIINSITNVTYTEATKMGDNMVSIPVPEGAAGAAFAVLTTFGPDAALKEDQLSQFGTLAGPAEVVLS